MFRSNKARLQAWITSSLLLVGACTDTSPVDSLSTIELDGASYSKAAVSGMAPGVAANDTSVLTGTALRIFWFEPTISYAISGRNKVAVNPTWTVRNTNVATVSSVS